ncbi:MAG: molybdopterin converting factor subunit 1 [Phycisphaeraceae bacterium]|nr:MAG: molybdopterin converting factor subunit 1 [Phycisphaeraceae bacterium]
MKVRILFFASLAERIERRSLELELPESASAFDAMEALVREHEAVAEMRGSLAIAVNQRIVSADAPLQDGDELALLPPVSGG